MIPSIPSTKHNCINVQLTKKQRSGKEKNPKTKGKNPKNLSNMQNLSLPLFTSNSKLRFFVCFLSSVWSVSSTLLFFLFIFFGRSNVVIIISLFSLSFPLPSPSLRVSCACGSCVPACGRCVRVWSCVQIHLVAHFFFPLFLRLNLPHQSS